MEEGLLLRDFVCCQALPEVAVANCGSNTILLLLLLLPLLLLFI
jgi:hypothetical protein